MVRVLFLGCVLALMALPATAKGLLHKWPVTETTDAGTVLTAQGAATGRGLTATIGAAIPMGDLDAPAAFDAEIERQMQDAEILKRTDFPRISLGGDYILFTTIDYETGWKGTKRMAMFAAYPRAEETSFRVTRADGPFDAWLMEHYSSDILVIAKEPDAAIAGTIALRPHGGTPKPAPEQKKTVDAPPSPSGASLPAPKGWKSKTFTDAVRYWPTFGKLAQGSKTGYFEALLFNPIPLDGKPLDIFLEGFVKDQERHFDVSEREPAKMDGPFRAWDFLRATNKNGVRLNVSYIAIQTGEDSARVIREIVTDTYHAKRNDYMSGLETIYGHVVGEAAAAFRAKDSAIPTIDVMLKRLRTENSDQRRARRNVAEDFAKARFLASISTEPGKGIQPEQLHGVLLRHDYLKRAYGSGNPRYAIFVLLKDGTAYRKPSRPPSDLNVEASRRIEKDSWYEWRRRGEGYEFRQNSQEAWEELKGELARPATSRTLDFEGRFIRAWGDVLMGTAGFSEGGITLTGTGRFETSSTTVAGGPSIIVPTPPSATVSVSKGKGGTQTTTMSEIAPALLNNTNRDPNGTDFTGQYALDGYTAEFLSDSGKLNRTLFLIPDARAIYLEGKHYTLPEEK